MNDDTFLEDRRLFFSGALEADVFFIGFVEALASLQRQHGVWAVRKMYDYANMFLQSAGVADSKE